MDVIHVETVVQSGGVIHITDLPYQTGDRVDAVIALHREPKERERESARQRLLERSRRSQFRSSGPYPTRDELHERD
jgi:hypothetical protein